MTMNLEILEVEHNRNGISGLGFYAIRFLWKPDGVAEPENFLATLFDEPGACAVIGLDRITAHGVAFAGGNLWRGDLFEQQLRDAVTNWENTGRVGPFCVPAS